MSKTASFMLYLCKNGVVSIDFIQDFTQLWCCHGWSPRYYLPQQVPTPKSKWCHTDLSLDWEFVCMAVVRHKSKPQIPWNNSTLTNTLQLPFVLSPAYYFATFKLFSLFRKRRYLNERWRRFLSTWLYISLPVLALWNSWWFLYLINNEFTKKLFILYFWSHFSAR